MRRLRCALPGIALLALSAGALGAATFQVDRQDDPFPAPLGCVDGVPNDCSLRGAVMRANGEAGTDRIVLGAGRHDLAIAGDDDTGATGDLDLLDEVELVGAGSGATEIHSTLADRVFDIRPGASLVTIRSLAISGGDTPDNGGGIRCDSALRLRDVLVTNNSAANGGGLMAHASCTAVLERVVFEGNSATGLVSTGGAILGLGILQLFHVRIHDNHAQQAGGGGLNMAGDTAILLAQDSEISNNSSRNGGGLHLYAGAQATLRSTRVSQNLSLDPVGDGSYGHGGGIWVYDSDLLVYDSEVSWNIAVQSGGGIFFDSDGQSGHQLLVANSSVSRNAAGTGGGVHVVGPADVDLVHDTMSLTQGDGVGLRTTNVQLTMANDLFDDPCDFRQGTFETSFGGNLETSGDTCRLVEPFDDHSVAPAALALSQSLQNNGGNSWTQALGPGSAALGFAFSGNCRVRDQRGAPRVAADCDSGAFQLVPGFLFADGFASGTDAAWSAAVP